MKRLFGFLSVLLFVALPLSVHAAVSIDFTCSEIIDNSRECVVKANTTEDEVTVVLTEKGGAKITKIEPIEDSDWNDVTNTEENGVYTVVAKGAVTGENDLFKFTYTVSGEEDCEVLICVAGADNCKSIKPPVNPNTGSSLPYVALISLSFLAGGAYILTKNKSKMYRI